MIHDLIIIIEKVKEKLTNDSDMLWTNYETAASLKAELEKYITALKAGKTDRLGNLNMHFLPTSTFQEHSLMNDWTEEYMKLANEFDGIYATIKNLK